MDPNTTLARLRAEVASHREHGDGDADALVDTFETLDEWLSRGGFPPAAWTTSSTTTVERVEHAGSALDDVQRELSAVSTLVEELVQELNAHPTWRT